jgi:hypothetical protein
MGAGWLTTTPGNGSPKLTLTLTPACEAATVPNINAPIRNSFFIHSLDATESTKIHMRGTTASRKQQQENPGNHRQGASCRLGV